MIPTDQIISLTAVEGVGPGRIRSIIRTYPHLDDIAKLTVKDLLQVERISHDIAGKIKKVDLDYGQIALDKIQKLGGFYSSYWDDDFPEPLRSVYDAPIGIFVLGTLQSIPCISIVGTRKPTPYGKKTTQNLTTALCHAGLGIVSGFARGTDTISHATALEQGGYTIAVLGNGVDICYPAENHKIRDQIIEKGAVISEFPPGTHPDAKHFPRRNRVISGLSRGVVVIEAGKKSGAVISALYALDQNREVFAVPGKIDNPMSYGCHRLIQQGAKLVTSVHDILLELKLEKVPQQITLLPNLTEEEERVFRILGTDEVHIDDLCSELQMDTPEMLSILLMLELKSLIIQQPGKYFIRA
jgi:DNA processing protein